MKHSKKRNKNKEKSSFRSLIKNFNLIYQIKKSKIFFFIYFTFLKYLIFFRYPDVVVEKNRSMTYRGEKSPAKSPTDRPLSSRGLSKS